MAGSPIRFSLPIQKACPASCIITPTTMVGSPSHWVRDTSHRCVWVGVVRLGKKGVDIRSLSTAVDDSPISIGEQEFHRMTKTKTSTENRKITVFVSGQGAGRRAVRLSIRLERFGAIQNVLPPWRRPDSKTNCRIPAVSTRLKAPRFGSNRLTTIFVCWQGTALISLTRMPELPAATPRRNHADRSAKRNDTT